MCFATTPFQSQQATYRMRRAFPADEDWSLHGVVLTRPSGIHTDAKAEWRGEQAATAECQVTDQETADHI